MKDTHTLELLRKQLGITKKEFSLKLGITQNAYTNYINRKRNIPTELALKIKHMFDIDIDWLLTGKGSMYIQSSNIEKKEPLSQNKEENYLIDKLSLQASAGAGITNYEVEVEEKLSISKAFFKTPQIPQNLKIIEIVGDSMEPTLLNGSYIVIDISKKGGIDGIYALLLQDEVFVKRLQFNLDQTIDIISDNPAYKTQKYSTNKTQINLKILGMKILTIQ